MKFIKNILPIIAGTLLFSSCNDEFLEKYPEDKFTNATFWKSDSDFRAYALGLYNFGHFGWGAATTDDVVRPAVDVNARVFDRLVVPEKGGAWSWSYLRQVNIMVDQARKNTTLSEKDRNHWLGVARFFRAREYFAKVRSFNDVPWVGKELGTSSEELFKPKDPRALVMDSVLADINFATENIREYDQKNQVNRDVALAVKSIICLHEGSYRKYHTELNLNDSERWFRECVDASEKLMKSGKYSLTPVYRDLYSSVDLAGNKECMLYYEFDGNIMGEGATFTMSLGSGSMSVTKDAAEAYLCKDGLPYGISPLHPKAVKGEPEFIEEEFKDRDPRMSMTLVVPYRDNKPTQLPAIDEAHSGIIPPFMPGFTGEAFITSHTGYNPYKFWNPDSDNSNYNTGCLDFPIYTYNRILLNYAEAKAELGECSNDVLNQSINLLRDRAGMPHMTVEQASSFNDPKRQKYAPEISPFLWEIRRERRVELMIDSYVRYDDIFRWKKASYFGKPFLGCYIDINTRPKEALHPDGTPKISVLLGDRDGNVINSTVGYVLPFRDLKHRAWKDDDLKMYYDPINKQDLVLNPNLTQSPGWENE